MVTEKTQTYAEEQIAIQTEEIQQQQNNEDDMTDAAQTTETELEYKAPDFTVFDEEGNEVRLSDMLGKPIVLNFWASWCPPCKSEMPDFNLVHNELGDSVNFMMIDAVDGVRETKKSGSAYIADNGFTFPVYYDMEQEAVDQYKIRSFPTTMFINEKGQLITYAEGAIDEQLLRKGISMITNELEISQKAEYRKISAKDAKSIIDSDEEIVILDVRTDSEFNEGHIKGALLIPDYDIVARANSDLPDKDAKILIYCRSGRRSVEAANELVNMGYTNVYDFGGIIDWEYDIETISD